jgi:DNA-binding response OmpR family regulator
MGAKGSYLYPTNFSVKRRNGYMKTSSLLAVIVDPNPQRQQEIIDWLHPHFQYFTASTLQDASDLVALHHPHLLIVEFAQQDGNSLQFVRRLRSRQATNRLIIVYTADSALPREKVAGFQSGVDHFLIRPINQEYHLAQLLAFTQIGHGVPLISEQKAG